MVLHINQQTDILAVIDVQNDFLPNGALEVKDGDQIIPVINHLLSHCFKYSFATQDWHPKNHISFAKNHPNAKPYDEIILPYGPQILWPTHAVQNTSGAKLASSLDQQYLCKIFQKGSNPNIDSYSAFYENDKKTSTGLIDWLKEIRIKRIFFTGLAEDFCVAYSAIDAVKAGFESFIIQDATKAIAKPLNQHETSLSKARKELHELRVTYLTSNDIVI